MTDFIVGMPVIVRGGIHDGRTGIVAATPYPSGNIPVAIPAYSYNDLSTTNVIAVYQYNPDAVEPFVTLTYDDARVITDYLSSAALSHDAARIRDRISRQIAPPKRDVYAHLAVKRDGGLVALCGKVWKRDDPNTIRVMGKCPECTDIAEGEWTA